MPVALPIGRSARASLAAALLLTGTVALGCEQVVETDAVRVFDKPGQPENTWGYDPKQIRVARGSAVTFTNDGAVFHTVTSDDPGRPFDKGIEPGQWVTIPFDQPGTFKYHCGVHPDMKGVVHVCDGPCR